MSANNSKPKAPVVVLREEPSNLGRYLFLFVPAAIGSVVFHVVIVVAFVAFIFLTSSADAGPKTEKIEDNSVVQADEPEKKETFAVVDVDPAATEFDTDIQYKNERIADVSVPGVNNPLESVGINGGDKSNPPINIAAPGGFGGIGTAAALEVNGPGNSMAIGDPGGYGPRGMPLQGSFYGRSGATREYALRNGGGTTESEAAVARGLKWLVAQQDKKDGKWMFNSPNLPSEDHGSANDTAATALGLLPFLAAGKTHKPATAGSKEPNPYDKVVDKGLKFLIKRQDSKGYFQGGMYAHGLATIAMCEAYGLSQDPLLRPHAQKAINLLVNIQHEGGGWRYTPEKQGGDMSVSGWQMMALKSAQMAGLDVPTITITRAKSFLQSSCNPDEGYSYTPGTGSTPRMTAVGLLCRQYMENWGPQHPRMIKSIQTIIKNNPPDRQDVYYYYYATQVMHHFGGEEWKTWNDKMREYLISKQFKANDKHANFGSWSAKDDQWGRSGGRLMMTSLNLLTLEVYYRYLPLYYRDAGYKMDSTVQKSL